LDLNKDLAQLNLKLAQISESLMYPASPCPGVVERIYVKVGQSVSPGTVLATIKGDQNTATAVAMVSQDIAMSLSSLGDSQTVIDGQPVTLTMRYVSQEATDGSLHSVLFSVPDEFSVKLANTSFLEVEVPVGIKVGGDSYLFVPLDAVHQGQAVASVYIVEDHDGQLKAVSKEVKLGNVYGAYVEVFEGLQPNDRIIINRNVIEGDTVTIQ